MKQPRVFRSIRFRLTVLYSTLLFALAGAALAITYFAVAQTTNAAPVTAQRGKLFEGREFVRQITFAEIE